MDEFVGTFTCPLCNAAPMVECDQACLSRSNMEMAEYVADVMDKLGIYDLAMCRADELGRIVEVLPMSFKTSVGFSVYYERLSSIRNDLGRETHERISGQDSEIH